MTFLQNFLVYNEQFIEKILKETLHFFFLIFPKIMPGKTCRVIPGRTFVGIPRENVKRIIGKVDVGAFRGPCRVS